jgi:hypothetical protein
MLLFEGRNLEDQAFVRWRAIYIALLANALPEKVSILNLPLCRFWKNSEICTQEILPIKDDVAIRYILWPCLSHI